MRNKIKESHKRLVDAMHSAITELINRELMHSDLSIIVQDMETSSAYIGQSLEDPLKIAYADKPEYKFDVKRRKRTTLMRFIRRKYGKLSSNIPDYVLEEFTAITMSLIADYSKFKVLYGNDIITAYTYCVGDESCMTGEDSDKVKLYGLYPEQIGLLVYDNRARALIWKTDNGVVFVDRIYPDNITTVELYHAYAIKQKYAFRPYNGAPCNDYIDIANTPYDTLTVTLRNIPKEILFPYIDTFHFGRFENHEKDLILSNSIDVFPYESNIMRFDSCNGGYAII